MPEKFPTKERKSKGFSAHKKWEGSELLAILAFPLLIFGFLFEDFF